MSGSPCGGHTRPEALEQLAILVGRRLIAVFRVNDMTFPREHGQQIASTTPLERVSRDKAPWRPDQTPTSRKVGGRTPRRRTLAGHSPGSRPAASRGTRPAQTSRIG